MQGPEHHLLKARLEKLGRLKNKGIDPYPHSYQRTHTTSEAKALFEKQEPSFGDNPKSESVSICGRIMSFRSMGKATFIVLKDGHSNIQVLFRKNNLEQSYDTLKDLDLGDWIGASGPIFRTRTGEITVEVSEWSILSKSLRTLPEKWHGLTDVETRFRQRYLDLISNDEARNLTMLRSQMVIALRRTMHDLGFIEVETPILVPVPAGGTAKPFSTYYNALDRELYLRIATELYLKRLIVGGIEKVFEIGRVFRNEGLDFYHNPEFTMMESYEAFVNYQTVMEMVETLVSGLALEVIGTYQIEFDGHTIDLSPPWNRLDLRQEIKTKSGIDFYEHPTADSLRNRMQSSNFHVGQQMSWSGLLDKLISDTVEPSLIQPTFLLDYPVEMSPLAKKTSYDGRLVERFEGFIAGMEICNAFSELNDPIDQKERMEAQELLQNEFKHEDMDRLDADFLIALEYGMPPTGGLGLGIDRIVMLFSGHRNIKEVILFPQLRSRD